MNEDVPARQTALSQALTRIELREAALLSWGAVDASFTRPEILSLIGDGLPARMLPADVLDEMLEALLVVETPEGGFRSRMAETMRLLATLRQSFPNRQWWEGPPLVLDQRFLHRPRSRPRRDVPAGDFLSRLATQVTPAAYRVAAAARPAGSVRIPGARDRGDPRRAPERNRPRRHGDGRYRLGKVARLLPSGTLHDRRVHRGHSGPRRAEPGHLPAQRTAERPVLRALAPGPGAAAGQRDERARS